MFLGKLCQGVGDIASRHSHKVVNIAFSQLRLRHKLEAAGAEIPFKMWLFPWLTWFVIIIILSVLAYMFFSPAYSYETTLSLGVTLGVVVCGLFVTRKRKATRSVAINQSNL